MCHLASRAAVTVSIVGLFAWLSGAPPASAHEPLEARSGTLYLKSSPDAEAYEALRVATTMQAQITGNVARVHVTQAFSNAGSDWVEGLYVFPLSADAAVDELFMKIGERTLRGLAQMPGLRIDPNGQHELDLRHRRHQRGTLRQQEMAGT